jgi:biopolymer transport protein ExbB
MKTRPTGRSPFTFFRMAWAAALVLVAGAVLWAQGAGAPGAAASPGTVTTLTGTASPIREEMPSLAYLYMTSPYINTIIVCLSVILLVMFVYYLLTITTGALAPQTFVDDVTKLAVGKQFEQAAVLCRNNRQIFAASILQRCFENANRDATHLMNIIDTEGDRRAGILWNRISYLMDLSAIAPMLGLLGTVLGMLQAFFGINRESASVSSKVLAQSIGGAMTATFFGLIVAILAVVFHSIIKSRALRALSDTEQIVHSITDYIKRGQA